jgi:hypothetical protein
LFLLKEKNLELGSIFPLVNTYLLCSLLDLAITSVSYFLMELLGHKSNWSWFKRAREKLGTMSAGYAFKAFATEGSHTSSLLF